MKIKVLYLMEGSSFGGGLRAFLQLARGLDPKIFEPFFACLPGGLLHRKIIESNIIFIPVDFSKKINPGLIGRLNRIFKRIKPDIVHSQALRIDFYARLAARMAGIPAVFSTIAMLVGDSGAGGIKRPVYRIMDWISRKCVTRFCVVSKHIRDKMIHAYNVDPKKISVIRNGIEPDIYDPGEHDRTQIRNKRGIPADAVVVGSVGRLAIEKAYHVFIKAAAQVGTVQPQIRFMLVGEGILRGRLENLAERLGLRNRFLFTGFKDNIPAMLSCMDIFVLSSVYEGNPIALIEAMAMAKPSVVTDIDAVREMTDNGISAAVVEPNNHLQMAEKIIDLANNKEKAFRMGQEAREKALTAFTIEKTIGLYEDLYKKALQGTAVN